jgi:hypothetical protein
MRDVVARVRGWWRLGSGHSGAGSPYEVACACGQVARGQRQATHQVIRCATCQQSVFVLPYSPLPRWSAAEVPANGAPRARTAAGRIASRWWLWPLVAGAVTLAVVVAGFALVLLPRLRPQGEEPRAAAAHEVEAHAEAGTAALAAGKFRLAADELGHACALLDRRRTPQRRQLVHLCRQAELLADLLDKSMGEILQSAAGQADDQEWQAQFGTRYRSRSVVFDADVTRDGAGQLRLDFHVQAGLEPARIDVSDLKLLAALPRDRPARLLFGARLASIAREPPGVWVVHFDPDSAVLLTDPAAVAAAGPGPVDEDLLALLRRQEAWLNEMP